MPSTELVPYTVTGVEEVLQMLRTAPRTVVAISFARALKAGATVIEEVLVAHIPMRELRVGGDADEPSLIEALGADITLDADFRGGQAEIGFGKQGYVANFVEYGHRLIGHKPALKQLGAVQPHPFMRPAAEVSADAAIEAFGDTLVATLKQDGLVDG